MEEEEMENEPSIKRGCLLSFMIIPLMLCGAGLGGTFGYYWAMEAARGKDAMFHPIIWAVPLGIVIGLVVAAAGWALFLGTRIK